MLQNILQELSAQSDLDVAAEKGDIQGIKSALKGSLIKKPADINGTDPERAPLLKAAVYKNADAVKYLLEQGADPNLAHIDHLLVNCYWDNQIDNMRTICSKLDKSKIKSVAYTIHEAIKKEDIDVTGMLLDLGITSEQTNFNGISAVASAVWRCNLDILKLLVDKGIELHTPENMKDGGLMCGMGDYVGEDKQLKTAEYLYENGVEINCVYNKFDETPLMRAAKSNYLDLMRFYIENGADMEMKNNAGDSVLPIAVSEAKTDVVELLLESGANVNIRNKEGKTPLTVAEMQFHNAQTDADKKVYRKIIQTLTEYGAVSELDKDGNLNQEDDEKTALNMRGLKKMIDEKTPDELVTLAEKNAIFLKRLAQTGLILEALQKLSYEQTSVVYNKAQDSMSKETKERAKDIIRNKRSR